MKYIAVALLVLAVGAMAYEITLPEEDLQAVFTGYMTKFNKMYAREEFFNRYRIWKQNYAFILHHNSLPAGQNKGVKLAANHLTDLTKAEYKAMLGFKLNAQKNGQVLTPMNEGEDNGDSVDWRTEGAVLPIKDQGQCGSCWAFSAVASAEAAVFIAGNPLVSLSEQELVDCTTNAPYECEGCNGCLMHKAFQYMIDKKGSCTEAEYPYTAEDGQCASSKCKAKKVPILSYANITCGSPNFCTTIMKTNETDMIAAVNKGVLSIAIEADQDVFQSYSSGILDDVECGTSLDHGVAIVGYGVENKVPYWIVRNSWGASWGEKGYVRIARGKNTCGIALYSDQPYAKKQ